MWTEGHVLDAMKPSAHVKPVGFESFNSMSEAGSWTGETAGALHVEIPHMVPQAELLNAEPGEPLALLDTPKHRLNRFWSLGELSGKAAAL